MNFIVRSKSLSTKFGMRINMFPPLQQGTREMETLLIINRKNNYSIVASKPEDGVSQKGDKVEESQKGSENVKTIKRAKTPIGKLDELEEGRHPYQEKEPLPPWPDNTNPHTGEIGGPRGPEPTRYGDWERKGRVSDF